MSKDFKVGFGRAMEEPSASSDDDKRRKRSIDIDLKTETDHTTKEPDARGDRIKRNAHPTFFNNGIIESLSSTVFRTKRQSDLPQMAYDDSIFDRIKQTITRMVDTAKEMVFKIRQSMSDSQQGGGQSQHENDESFK